MTFLVHKEHGATNVSESEVPDMVKIGWIVSTHAEWMADHGKGTKVEELVQVERKKPGRKPNQVVK